MALTDVTDLPSLRRAIGDGVAWIGFFGAFSDRSERQLPVFRELAERHPDKPIFLVDVAKVKDVHRAYGVSAVPVVVRVRGESVLHVVAGERPHAEYEALVSDAPRARRREGGAKRTPRVTVYTSPTCVWCGRLKDYLRRRSVAFREVDVARDPAQAEKLVARSGQMGVPQTDVDGTIVVGFDKARLDDLLGLSREAA